MSPSEPLEFDDRDPVEVMRDVDARYLADAQRIRDAGDAWFREHPALWVPALVAAVLVVRVLMAGRGDSATALAVLAYADTNRLLLATLLVTIQGALTTALILVPPYAAIWSRTRIVTVGIGLSLVAALTIPAWTQVTYTLGAPIMYWLTKGQLRDTWEAARAAVAGDQKARIYLQRRSKRSAHSLYGPLVALMAIAIVFDGALLPKARFQLGKDWTVGVLLATTPSELIYLDDSTRRVVFAPASEITAPPKICTDESRTNTPLFFLLTEKTSYPACYEAAIRPGSPEASHAD